MSTPPAGNLVANNCPRRLNAVGEVLSTYPRMPHWGKLQHTKEWLTLVHRILNLVELVALLLLILTDLASRLAAHAQTDKQTRTGRGWDSYCSTFSRTGHEHTLCAGVLCIVTGHAFQTRTKHPTAMHANSDCSHRPTPSPNNIHQSQTNAQGSTPLQALQTRLQASK